MKTQYIRKNSYESIELDGEWIILNTDNYTVTKINEIGGFCWSLLDQTRSIDSMILAVKEKYDLTDETVEKDLEVFLSDMLECGLIQHAV